MKYSATHQFKSNLDASTYRNTMIPKKMEGAHLEQSVLIDDDIDITDSDDDEHVNAPPQGIKV